MTDYPFILVNGEKEGTLEERTVLRRRPKSGIGYSFAEDTRRFVAEEESGVCDPEATD